MRSRKSKPGRSWKHGVWVVLAWHAVSIVLLATGAWSPFEVMVVMFADACLVGVRMFVRLVAIGSRLKDDEKSEYTKNTLLQAYVAAPIVALVVVILPGQTLWDALAPSGQVAQLGLSAEAVEAGRQMFSDIGFWVVLLYMSASQFFVLKRELKGPKRSRKAKLGKIVVAMIVAPMTFMLPLIPLAVGIEAGREIDTVKTVAYPIGLYYVCKALIEALLYIQRREQVPLTELASEHT